MKELDVHGHLVEPPPMAPIASMSLRLVPLDMVAHWRRVSVTANFIASYLAYDLQGDPVGNILSTVANELLENPVKFSVDKRMPIDFELEHFGTCIVMNVANVSSREHAARLAHCLDRIYDEDPDELFIEQLERTAASDRTASGIGLLLLRKDYGARVGMRLRDLEDGRCRVELRVLVTTVDMETQ